MPHRTLVLFLFLIFSRIDSHSQADKNHRAVYDAVPGMLLVTDDTTVYKIGIFKMGKSLGGKLLHVDSNAHFETTVYACMGGGGILDSGTWLRRHSGVVSLTSKTGVKTFDLIRYRHFYFFVPQDQKSKFVADLLTSQKQCKNFKPMYIGDVLYTADDLPSINVRSPRLREG